MDPKSDEIETVSKAITVINDREYVKEEADLLSEFLQSYAADYPKKTFESLFKEDTELLTAVDTIYQFVESYHSNLDLMNELKSEMDALYYNINQTSGDISI